MNHSTTKTLLSGKERIDIGATYSTTHLATISVLPPHIVRNGVQR